MNEQNLQKVIHGGTVIKARKATGAHILDFSASINPYPPQFPLSISRDDLSEYPDDSYSELKTVIATRYRVSPGEITLGNGSIEVLRTFCHALLSPGDRVGITFPTFGEYEFSSRLAGAVVGSGANVKVRFICNPNNPTGHLLAREEICALLENCVDSGATLFLDEAFMEISDDPTQGLAGTIHPNLFVLRSLTKSFSVPGIRFGYGIGHADLVARLELVRPPWNVSSIAEKVAIEAFNHYDELEHSRKRIVTEKEWLCSALQDLSVKIEPSRANFLLVHTGNDVKDLCSDLLMKGILVRDCHSFGLPEAIRIAVRTHEENAILVEALSSCMH